MSWPKYYNIYKKSNQGTMWKRQVIQFMKQSSLLKFWKAGFIMKRFISIHWNTLRGVVDLINSDIHTRITLVCSVHS